MTNPEPTFEYKASVKLLGLIIIACLVFSAVAVGALLIPGTPRFVVWVGAGGALLSIGGITEVLVGRVVLEPEVVAVTQWFRTKRVPFSEIASVSLEGGITALRLKTGAWHRLPEWLGANKSLGRRIRDRLKQSDSAAG